MTELDALRELFKHVARMHQTAPVCWTLKNADNPNIFKLKDDLARLI